MKTAAAEAITMQKEIDLQCQHKITEMLALMEKHKVNILLCFEPGKDIKVP